MAAATIRRGPIGSPRRRSAGAKAEIQSPSRLYPHPWVHKGKPHAGTVSAKRAPRWPSIYNAWLAFAKFSSVTDPIEGYVGAIDAAVRAACAYTRWITPKVEPFNSQSTFPELPANRTYRGHVRIDAIDPCRTSADNGQASYSPARAVPRLSGNRNGLDSLQRGSGAHARNGRDPAVDQEVCPDDVRRIVRREINRQLRDFRRIGHPLAGIVGCKDALDGVALLFACEATEHRRVRRTWA